MYGLDDPVDARITAISLVLRVDKYDLEIFVGRVLVDPVRVQHSQIGAAASYTLFGGRLERALILQLIDTLIRGFAFETFLINVFPKTRAVLQTDHM